MRRGERGGWIKVYDYSEGRIKDSVKNVANSERGVSNRRSDSVKYRANRSDGAFTACQGVG